MSSQHKCAFHHDRVLPALLIAVSSASPQKPHGHWEPPKCCGVNEEGRRFTIKRLLLREAEGRASSFQAEAGVWAGFKRWKLLKPGKVVREGRSSFCCNPSWTLSFSSNPLPPPCRSLSLSAEYAFVASKGTVGQRQCGPGWGLFIMSWHRTVQSGSVTHTGPPGETPVLTSEVRKFFASLLVDRDMVLFRHNSIIFNLNNSSLWIWSTFHRATPLLYYYPSVKIQCRCKLLLHLLFSHQQIDEGR